MLCGCLVVFVCFFVLNGKLLPVRVEGTVLPFPAGEDGKDGSIPVTSTFL